MSKTYLSFSLIATYEINERNEEVVKIQEKNLLIVIFPDALRNNVITHRRKTCSRIFVVINTYICLAVRTYVRRLLVICLKWTGYSIYLALTGLILFELLSCLQPLFYACLKRIIFINMCSCGSALELITFYSKSSLCLHHSDSGDSLKIKSYAPRCCYIHKCN